MGDRGSPPQVSITVRRLVLPERGPGPELGEAIAAALDRRLRDQAPPRTGTGLAEAIAHRIAGHPQLASLSTGRKRT